MIRMPRIVTSLHWRAAPTVRATRPRRLHSGHRHPFLNGLTPKRSSLPYSANWNHVTFISFSCNNLQSSFELRMSLLPPVVDPHQLGEETHVFSAQFKGEFSGEIRIEPKNPTVHFEPGSGQTRSL